MRRKVLIVDDNGISRQILAKILSDDYDVLEAENGREALAVMRRSYRVLSAVLLDIIMPVTDGYEVLSQMRDNAALSQLPVIVITGNADKETELRCLALGANDFVAKPFHPAIIKHRLKNTIHLRETASIINALQRDKLTGLYNRETFFEKAAALIAAHRPGYYVIAAFDIDNFKICNDQYGTEEGDEILRSIGRIAREGFSAVGGIACRLNADEFAALYPYGDEQTDYMIDMRALMLDSLRMKDRIFFSIGRYVVNDTSLPPSAMYDRAYLAKHSVKGRYDKRVAFFDESMREQLLHDREIVGEMEQALQNEQFELWYQPQYDLGSGALIGAEALVRWRHPERGLIAPGEFIPVFERNGFVYELDKEVWRQACSNLRRWMDGGLAPLPVSVNISRYDVFREDFFEYITGLLTVYDIPASLLRLEITESAFAQSSKDIIAVVQRLVDYGYTVEIDDFGSGYSSLNTLKEVPAGVLKLDMDFLRETGNTGRGGNIVESVIRMAKWLGMPVVAEGVETQAQAEYLRSIGCHYGQGYHFAKPMPAAEYESLIQSSRTGVRVSALETALELDNNAFWDPKSMDTLVFNNFIGGACLFEYHAGKIELLRANRRFLKEICGDSLAEDADAQTDWAQRVDDADRERMCAKLTEALSGGGEVVCESGFHDLPGGRPHAYLRVSMRVIASATDRHMIYCRADDLSAQHEAEEKERAAIEETKRLNARLETSNRMFEELMDNLPCGAGVYEILPNERTHIVYLNKSYKELVGREVIFDGDPSQLSSVYQDDMQRLYGLLHEAIQSKRQEVSFMLRLLHGDGRYHPFRIAARLVSRADGKLLAYVTFAPVSEGEWESGSGREEKQEA